MKDEEKKEKVKMKDEGEEKQEEKRKKSGQGEGAEGLFWKFGDAFSSVSRPKEARSPTGLEMPLIWKPVDPSFIL